MKTYNRVLVTLVGIVFGFVIGFVAGETKPTTVQEENVLSIEEVITHAEQAVMIAQEAAGRIEVLEDYIEENDLEVPAWGLE